MSDWTKCSEQMPPSDTEVIVWPFPNSQGMTAEWGQLKDGSVSWSYWSYENGYGWGSHDVPHAVTHWMPIPTEPED